MHSLAAKPFYVLVAALTCLIPGVDAQVPAPNWPVAKKTWVDTKTGHRVIRVSEDPFTAMLYFDENAFTSDGRDMIYIAPNAIYDLKLADFSSHKLLSGKFSHVIVGSKSRRIFYQSIEDGHLYALDLDTGKKVSLPTLEPEASATTINADETLLAGTMFPDHSRTFEQYALQAVQETTPLRAKMDASGVAAHAAAVARHANPTDPQLTDAYRQASLQFEADRDVLDKALKQVRIVAGQRRMEAHAPEHIFTFDLKTGETKIIYKGIDWLSHVVFSPTDPTLILYAHEGPSQKVDRVWTIRTDGSQNHLLHKASDPVGIATHQFWGPDGKTVWFDVQEKKGEDFAVAGVDATTGNELKYRLTKAEASLHYNISPNGKLFCGDGNVMTHGEIGVNGHRTLDRQWIELLRPAPDFTFHSTRLVSVANNDYSQSEPGVRFTPDGKWILFNSNMFGPNYIYAVEIQKEPVSSTPVSQ